MISGRRAIGDKRTGEAPTIKIISSKKSYEIIRFENIFEKILDILGRLLYLYTERESGIHGF